MFIRLIYLELCLFQLLKGIVHLADGSLFPSLDSECNAYIRIMKGIESLDSSCFYGRPLGFQVCSMLYDNFYRSFQFPPSVARIFRVIGVVLATYSLSWEKGHGAIGSLINSGRFLLNPEQRAQRILMVLI